VQLGERQRGQKGTHASAISFMYQPDNSPCVGTQYLQHAIGLLPGSWLLAMFWDGRAWRDPWPRIQVKFWHFLPSIHQENVVSIMASAVVEDSLHVIGR
jgi:hypothetical protein